MGLVVMKDNQLKSTILGLKFLFSMLTMENARVIILDDHTLFRMGFCEILKNEPGFVVVGEYSGFAQLKPLIPTLGADLIFVDISLEEESGLDVAKYIKTVNPKLKVIILSTHKEEFYVINALEAGVDGYIHKTADPAELVKGVQKVLKGGTFYSLEISGLLINSAYTHRQKALPFLTPKEKEVIRYVLDGYSNKEIADKMDISPRTIETHRANVLNKFNLKNTTELIKKILEHKIQL
jgi:DNA-binding NarL/FixJ family response regulator